MAITRSQFKNAGGGPAASLMASFDNPTASGSLIVVMVSHYYGNNDAGQPGSTVSDDKGNTYSRAVYQNGGTVAQQEIWYAENITGGSDHQVTWTKGAGTGSSYLLMTVLEYSGIAASGALDKTAVAYENTSDTTYTTASTATTSQADELLIAVHQVLSAANSFTPDSPWTKVTEFSGGFNEHAIQEQIVSSTGAYASSGTLGTAVTSKGSALATFKGIAAPGGGFQAAWARGSNVLIGGFNA